MDYLDLYRRRTAVDGFSEQERITNKLSKDFLQLVQRSPNKETISVDGQEIEVIIQSGNSRVGTQTEKKVIQYLLTPRNCLLSEGTKFYTSDVDGIHAWIILHREVHSSYGYFKYKILELNRKIKYINSQGVLKVLEAYVNGTHEFDIKEYFTYSNRFVLDKPNRALNLIHPTISDIDKNCRFYIGNDTWRYVDEDEISIPGISYTTIFQTTTDEQTTNKQEEIANMDELHNSIIVSSLGDGEEINLSMNMQNCQFYMKTKGKMTSAGFTYFVSNSCLKISEEGKIIPLQVGKCEVIVQTAAGLSKTFVVNVLDTEPLYFNLLGNNSVKMRYEQSYEIITNYNNLSFQLSNPQYGSLKIEGDTLTFSANDKIGEVEILCYSNSEVISTFAVEITSLYI